MSRMIWMILGTALAFALLAGSAGANGPLEGTLKERGTRKPMPGVNVYLLREGQPALKGTTGPDGRFAVENVPPGPFKWVVNQTGYEKLEQYDEQTEVGPFPPRDLALEKTSYLTYETTIYDKAAKRDDRTRSITQQQFTQLAGSGGDPIKAVQNLPGVSRSGGFSAAVIIEGSPPGDTLYSIDQIEVPLVFHFAGLTTVVPPESVERVDLLTSGYGSEFSRTTSGQVAVYLKAPPRDRIHGMGFVDIFNVGGNVEGPVSERGSFFLSARQSYIGAVLKTVLKNNADLNFNVAPDFSDATAIYAHEVTPIDSLKVTGIGSLDTLNFIFAQPVKSNPAIRGNFSSLNAFYRLIPQWTHRHSARATSRLALGWGRDWLRLDTGDNFFHLQADNLAVRYETERAVNEYWKTFWGVDNTYVWARADLVLPKTYSQGGVSNPFAVSETRAVNILQAYDQIGTYWRNEVRLGGSPFTLVPAIRADYFSQTRELLPQPRLQIRYKWSDSLTLRSASGLYAQPPEPQETDPSYGNPDVKAPLGVHFTAGFEKDLRGDSDRGWSVNADGFYKQFYRLVNPSAGYAVVNGVLTPENYNNDLRGRVYGLQAQARYDYKWLSGWIAYTLSRSTRFTTGRDEYISRYDQTHNLNLNGSVQLGKNWQLSARFRLVSGNPYTPITGGTFDADNDVYIPARGSFYSERVSPFHQLDVRVDKKWIFKSWILSAYLDVQNVLNHANIEAIRNSFDYTSTAQIEGLPFVPTFGVKGEF